MMPIISQFWMAKCLHISGFFVCSKCNRRCYLTTREVGARKECVCDNCIKYRKKEFIKDIKITRKALINERGSTCESCGRVISISKYLHMHHIDRNRNNNSDDNLILLCATCHKKQHKDKPYIVKFLKPQSDDMESQLFPTRT